MSRTVVYEMPQEGARPVAWWWSILQLILMFLISAVGAIILAFVGAIIAVSIAALNGSWDPAAGSEPPPFVIGVAVISAMLGLFISLALCGIVKTKMEKRSLASAGLSGFFYGPRFWGGFLGGAGIVALLAVPISLAAMVFGMPEEMSGAMNPQNLMSGQFVLALVLIFLFVIIQAPAEEIVFRGWLLSALGLRHGLVTAVVASSLLFTLFHADRVVAGFGWLVYALIAVGSIGVLFAAVSYHFRSVLPAAGLHTGYNFFSIALGLSALMMQAENPDVMTAIMELVDLEGMEPFQATPTMLVDLAARGAIPLAIAFWLFSRTRREPSAVPSAA